MKDKEVLLEMIKIYRPFNEDWMGFKVSRSNKFTFHHIVEKRNGGLETIENGAIVTRVAHQHLNFLEDNYPEMYDEWQQIFRMINDSKTRPDEEMIAKIKVLKFKGKELERGR